VLESEENASRCEAKGWWRESLIKVSVGARVAVGRNRSREDKEAGILRSSIELNEDKSVSNVGLGVVEVHAERSTISDAVKVLESKTGALYQPVILHDEF
jgi:hypothetical protein